MTTHTVEAFETHSRESARQLRLAITDPADVKNRPPVYDEMMPDINRLIHSVCAPYVDPSCIQLNLDELVADCQLKVARILDGGYDKKIRNRMEFFKFLKASLNNHVRGLVQRHRFTIKRTGHKPPDKDDWTADHRKTVEISLDDPDAHLQLSGTDEGFVDPDYGIFEEWITLLSPIEALVANQLRSPNAEAINLAKVDMWSTGSTKLKVTFEHLAGGIGISLEVFSSIRRTLATKLHNYINMDEDIGFNLATKALAETFSLEIPKSTSKIIIRRMMSLAARTMVNKLTPTDKANLRTIGAVVPEISSAGLINCFGIMHDASNSKCQACGMKSACSVRTEQVGLDVITPHPTLLGRSTRMPVVSIDPDDMGRHEAPASSLSMPPVPEDDESSLSEDPDSTERTAKIVAFLTTTFRSQNIRDSAGSAITQVGYGIRGPSNPSPILWRVLSGRTDRDPIRLRFTKPSPALAAKLEKDGSHFYLPTMVSVGEAIQLISKHADEKSIRS